MSFKEEKQKLRRTLRATHRPSAEESAAAAANLIACPEYQSAKTIFCFVGAHAEFDTTAIINDALLAGKVVCVPLCMGRGLMEARRINALSDLVSTGSFGILEPSGRAPLMRPEEIDFAVIPCLACDKRGFRLGHGGGYYDRYLENVKFAQALLCHSEQIVDRLPADAWDVSIRLIVTEKGILRPE